MTLEGIARVAHEANRAYCASIGDHSQKPWDEAEDWQQQSAMIGVLAIINGEVSSPEGSHAGWYNEKHAQGWSWGLEKDPERKLHPCMVPYDLLPEAQRAKDRLFLAVVKALGEELA